MEEDKLFYDALKMYLGAGVTKNTEEALRILEKLAMKNYDIKAISFFSEYIYTGGENIKKNTELARKLSNIVRFINENTGGNREFLEYLILSQEYKDTINEISKNIKYSKTEHEHTL